jgi:hypothetical protein
MFTPKTETIFITRKAFQGGNAVNGLLKRWGIWGGQGGALGPKGLVRLRAAAEG